MIAYLFWYRFARSIETPVFEARLSSFHKSIEAAGPQGLLSSVSFRIEGATWLGGEGPAYEDWYFLESTAALEELNETAVGPACKSAHHAVSPHISSSAAGLYKLRLGTDSAANASLATWLNKPADMSYDDFDVAMALALSEDGGGIWAKQMALGPTPEFCLLDDSHPFGKTDLVGAVVKRERLWPRQGSEPAGSE